MGIDEEESQATPPPWGWRGGARKKPTAPGKSCVMRSAGQTRTRKFDAMGERKHAIRRDPWRHFTDRQREMSGRVWNQYVNRPAPISMRDFARIHNVPYETWRRECSRGAAGRTVRSGNRRTYAGYDLEKGRASIAEGRANMGAGMRLTVGMAILFRHFVPGLRRSPYDAGMAIPEAIPDRKAPCLKTFCNHVEARDTRPLRDGRRRLQKGDARRPLGHAGQTSFRRGGHDYVALLVDAWARSVVDARPGRDGEAETAFGFMHMEGSPLPNSRRIAIAMGRMIV